MKKLFLFFYFLLMIINVSFSQRAGIGTNTPDASALLDVQSPNKGMLIPRIALTSANTASPVATPTDALLIYNTSTTGSGVNTVSPGFYYWNNASSKWTSISSSTATNNTDNTSWGDCNATTITGYNPVADETGSTGAFFGSCSSISGNYAIIGAPYDNVGAVPTQGSASIYQFNGSSWLLMQKLTDATGATNDQFGISVSISGNYAIVGSSSDDIGANTDQGSASIYQYNGSSWVLMNKITDVTGAAGDQFGNNISISGNYAIIGAWNDDDVLGANQGSASIYQYNGTNWVLMNKITDATGAANDFFGKNVSISGNYAAIGSYRDDVGANTDQGSVIIYQYNGTNWVFMQKLTDATGAAGDQLGSSVCISGNMVIAGSPLDDFGTSAVDAGSVSIYQYNGSSWVLSQKLFDIANGEAGYAFGSSVSISGNYFIAGAFQQTVNNNIAQGSASIFQKVGTTWIKSRFIIDPSGYAKDYFGISASMDSSNNRFVIGALGYGNYSGKVVFGRIN